MTTIKAMREACDNYCKSCKNCGECIFGRSEEFCNTTLENTSDNEVERMYGHIVNHFASQIKRATV